MVNYGKLMNISPGRTREETENLEIGYIFHGPKK